MPGIPRAVVPVLAAQDTDETVFDTEPVAREFGVRLTPLEPLARRQLAE